MTEARNGADLFGEGRLLDWLRQHRDVPVAELPSGLLAHVLAFSGGELRDDIAILAIEIDA